MEAHTGHSREIIVSIMAKFAKLGEEIRPYSNILKIEK